MQIENGMDFSKEELEKIEKMLTTEENYAKAPYKWSSGGFAVANVYDADDEFIDVELVFGIQNDVTNETHTENLKIDRNTFEWA